MMITRVSGKLWKGMRERWMEILFMVLVIVIVYYLFHKRIAESYTEGKNVYSKDEIRAMKNKYLDTKSAYDAADRAYNDPKNEVDYPITTADFTPGDPRILSLPLPTKAYTYPNRDGNDPYKICGSKFLNYEPGSICLDTRPQDYLRVTTQTATCKSTAGNYGVYDKDDNLLFDATYECDTSTGNMKTDKCPAESSGRNNAKFTCLTGTLPTDIHGSSTAYILMDPANTTLAAANTKADSGCGSLKAYKYITSGNDIGKPDKSGSSTITTNTIISKSTDKVNPVNIPGCYTYRQAKKTDMENAWNIYSPFAPRKKKRSRRKFRFF